MTLIFKEVKNKYYQAIIKEDHLKIGLVAKKHNQINYHDPLDQIRFQEKAILQSLLEIEKKDILFLDQVHQDKIFFIERRFEEDFPVVGSGDGFFTPLEKVCLVIRTADCVPVFIFDKKKKILGAVHSGWKGSWLEISAKLVRQLKKNYDSKSSDLKVFILPGIGPQAYEVGQEVAENFSPDCLVKKADKFFLNLPKVICQSLEKENISSENILITKICSFTSKKDFFSHRQGDLGRNLNFAYLIF